MSHIAFWGVFFIHAHELFSVNDFLDLVQFVERLQRSEAVDVEILDFVTDLAEHRVIKLEETELHAALAHRLDALCLGSADAIA